MEVKSHPKSVKVLAYYLFFFCSAPIGTTGFSRAGKICKSVGRAQQTVTFPTCSLFSLLTILPVFVPPFLLFGSPRDGVQQTFSDLFFFSRRPLWPPSSSLSFSSRFTFSSGGLLSPRFAVSLQAIKKLKTVKDSG